MRRLLLLLCLFAGGAAQAQMNLVLQDNFADSNARAFEDLSLLLNWGGNTTPVSAFKFRQVTDAANLTYNAITLSPEAQANGSYTSATGLKTSNAFDYIFGALDRTNDSIVLQFDAIWNRLDNGGENGRIVVAFMHQHPGYGQIPFNTIHDSVTALAPFGRPAYNWRVLGRSPQGNNNYAHLFYGGGKDAEGEYEKYNTAPNVWWLPGFISMPGGFSPGSKPNYPEGPGYSWRANTLASAAQWQHYRFAINANEVTIRTRPSSGSGPGVLTNYLYMPPVVNNDSAATLALINARYGTSLTKLPDYYNYWPNINALRFFLNTGGGGIVASVANVLLEYSGIPASAKASQQARVQLWPNPAVAGQHQLQTSTDARFALCDLSGRQLSIGQLQAGQVQVLPTSSLAPGIYMVRVSSATGQQVRKLVVE